MLSGARVGAVFHLDRSELMIGRSQRAELSFEDDGVSRTHARIRREGSEYIVEDLGSRNGTFVNGLRVKGPTRVQDGDKLQLGRSTILKFFVGMVETDDRPLLNRLHLTDNIR